MPKKSVRIKLPDGREVIPGEDSLPEQNEIERILTNFTHKIDTVGINHPQTKKVAFELLIHLIELKDEAFKVPNWESMKNFEDNAKQAIKKAMPTLEKDLGWGDYLKNMLKQIANALTYGLLGKHSFFVKTSEAAASAQSLDNELQENIKPNN